MAEKSGHSPTDRRAVRNEQMAKTTPARGTIRVRALRTGYYEHIRRREGDVFDLIPRETVRFGTAIDPTTKRRTKTSERLMISADQQFSAEWMEEVNPRTPLSTSTANEEIRRQHDEILALRRPDSGQRLPSDESHDQAATGSEGAGGPTGEQDPLGSGQ